MARHLLRPRGVERLPQPGGSRVRSADRPDLPGADQPVVGAERLFDRRARIWTMTEIEVYAVGAQALERRFDPGGDALCGKPLAVGPGGCADLGDEHDRLAPRGRAFEPVADDGFGFAALVARHPARVHVCGIDGVEAGVDEAVEQAKSGRLVDGPAEDVAAEDERRDAKAGAAEDSEVHPAIIGEAARGTKAKRSRTCRSPAAGRSQGR